MELCTRITNRFNTVLVLLFCFKQKTAYEMRNSDWSSDVCASDLSWGLLNRANRVKKRALDLALTIPALGVLLPLMAMVALAIKLARKNVGQGKRGPVRVALGGRRVLTKKITHNDKSPYHIYQNYLYRLHTSIVISN